MPEITLSSLLGGEHVLTGLNPLPGDAYECDRLIRLAADLASRAHTVTGQTYDGAPYRYHLEAVSHKAERVIALGLAELGHREDSEELEALYFATKIIGSLHDIVEDTEITVDTISYLFGPFVARAVWICSDPELGFKANRKMRKQVANAHYAAADRPGNYFVVSEHYRYDLSNLVYDIAATVKLADRYANVISCKERNSDMFGMYAKEHTAFKLAISRERNGQIHKSLWDQIEETF